MCLVEWVQPNSTGSNEKTLWYLAKSCWAESANSGGHDSNPLRSSSSNSLPYLCLTVNLGVWGLRGSSPLLASWSPLVAVAPQLQPLLWPLGFSFWVFGGRPYYSTITAFLLPFLSLVYMFWMVRPCSREPSLVCSAWVMMLMCSPM